MNSGLYLESRSNFVIAPEVWFYCVQRDNDGQGEIDGVDRLFEAFRPEECAVVITMLASYIREYKKYDELSPVEQAAYLAISQAEVRFREEG